MQLPSLPPSSTPSPSLSQLVIPYPLATSLFRGSVTHTCKSGWFLPRAGCRLPASLRWLQSAHSLVRLCSPASHYRPERRKSGYSRSQFVTKNRGKRRAYPMSKPKRINRGKRQAAVARESLRQHAPTGKISQASGNGAPVSRRRQRCVTTGDWAERLNYDSTEQLKSIIKTEPNSPKRRGAQVALARRESSRRPRSLPVRFAEI